MNQIDTIIDNAIYSVNPSTGVPYPLGYIQVADGIGARRFTNSLYTNSLLLESTLSVTSSITTQGIFTTSSMNVRDIYPALRFTSLANPTPISAQLRYNKTANAIDLLGATPPSLDLSANTMNLKALTMPAQSGTPAYITIGGSENAYPPVGMISLYGGAAPPLGWLPCDGTTRTKTAYPSLFAIIGTTYGPATTTTFTLPATAQLPTIPAPPLGIYMIKY